MAFLLGSCSSGSHSAIRRDAHPRRTSSSAPTAAGEGASAEIQLNIENLLPVSKKELEIA